MEEEVIKELNIKGCWNLIQAVVQHAFEQARDPKTNNMDLEDLRAWAREKPNKILSAYSDISELDYDVLVDKMVELCNQNISTS